MLHSNRQRWRDANKAIPGLSATPRGPACSPPPVPVPPSPVSIGFLAVCTQATRPENMAVDEACMQALLAQAGRLSVRGKKRVSERPNYPA